MHLSSYDMNTFLKDDQPDFNILQKIPKYLNTIELLTLQNGTVGLANISLFLIKNFIGNLPKCILLPVTIQ